MEEIKFELSKPLEYSKSDKLEKTKTLTLRAFNIRDHKSQTLALRQMFFRALNGIRRQGGKEDDSESEDTQMTPEGVIMALNASESLDIDKFYNDVEDFLCNGVVFVDKDISLTKGLLQELQENDFDDFEMLVGKYISTFTLPSWMKRLTKKSKK